MSSTTLRFYPVAFSFIQTRRERRMGELGRLIRIHAGPRRIKKFLRNIYA